MQTLDRLSSEAELDALFEETNRRPVLVFKHSLTCPVSSAAFAELHDFLSSTAPDGVRYTLIEVQHERALSNAVAQRTGVRHESPQALLLRDGEVVWHASHGAIRVSSLASAVSAQI